MKSFPNKLLPTNKINFYSYRYNRVLCYFRKEIYEHMLKGDENNYFELDRFSKQYLDNDTNTLKKMTTRIIQELETLGWKCKTSFGDTGLFIYSSEDPPKSCW
ncbi:unnamed protein product [marine sediment metagenome]|uniref:Uncharacterized protein n=1 Tax=marine sediment metagenome TaxID=412755 RepID=X0S9N5_9ZZZZ